MEAVTITHEKLFTSPVNILAVVGGKISLGLPDLLEVSLHHPNSAFPRLPHLSCLTPSSAVSSIG
jgi:hypothetical protein